MTTSGSTNYNLNARQVVTFALRKLRVSTPDSAPAAEDFDDAITALNLMLKGWQMTGPNLFRQTQGSLVLTDATESYPLTMLPVYRIISARFRQNSRDLPMELLTREEYFDMPLKSSTGIPTSYYFDPQISGGTLYVWPVLATAAGETIEYTYQAKFQDIDAATDDLPVPQEWLETVGYALAVRLMPDYGKGDSTADKMIIALSNQLIAEAKAADREPVYRFEPDRRYGR